MNRCQVLFQSQFLAVKRFDHPPDVPHVDDEETRSPAFSVNFAERGSFTVSWGSRTARVTSDNILVTTPGFGYHVRHDDDAPNDVILGIAFQDHWRDHLTEVLPESRVARSPVTPVTNRRAYLRRRLVASFRHSPPTLCIDSIGAELLAAVGDEGNHHRRYRDSQLSWYAGRVDAARELLDEAYALDHSLSALAGEAGMSPFHFARVFRELVGLPPHRYLTLRRLAKAGDRLAEGMSVTRTCFEVGFRNLSHFTHTFRRAYGMTPSHFARRGWGALRGRGGDGVRMRPLRGMAPTSEAIPARRAAP